LEIPKVGLVMENARLVRWLKQVGEAVRQGEPLLELETEKSVVEIEAADSGRLVEILLQADQQVQVGDRVGWLETDLAAAPPVGHAGQATAAPKAAAVSAASAPTAAAEPPAASTGRIKSSPVARRLAAQHGLDLRHVQATGPRGRIQLIDVRRAIESTAAEGPSPSADPTPPPAPQPLATMRRAIARSMTLSNATVPQFFVERSVDWTTVQAARARLLKDFPEGAPRPSVNDFILQAIARTLLIFPQLNATFTGDANASDAAILPARGTHIGLVVAVENGLLVPVLHNVDRIGLGELARRRSETVQRALSGRLKRDELEGATISLSNLGAKGPDRFTAIISPPQSAILAVGRQRDCVVAMGGGIYVKPMSQLTLTVDHRVADGRLAADFLAALTDTLEGDRPT
jgi:pyruvate dehydrogenase E2 component (dihydrolipoamide acetyltransferase)